MKVMRMGENRLLKQVMMQVMELYRRWGSVEARFGNKFKDVWVGRIAS